MKNGERLQQGFTLLEVMVALAIVSIALVTLLGLSNRSIGVNHKLQRITQATLLAQQQMTEIEVAAAQIGFQFEESEGVFDDPFEEYRWRIEYEDSPLPSLRLIKVTVAWGDEARNEAVDLTSFVFIQI
ncbi:MAG: type II secretion system minor pseudopilin GspI [Desulfuromonadales bacterium]|nr:type II secretion system minor pseudopilin GspI [Desulfuromonadales bacterium]